MTCSKCDKPCEQETFYCTTQPNDCDHRYCSEECAMLDKQLSCNPFYMTPYSADFYTADNQLFGHYYFSAANDSDAMVTVNEFLKDFEGNNISRYTLNKRIREEIKEND